MERCMVTDIYLVDCENVGNRSLNLPATCDVYYFLTCGQIKDLHPNDIVKEITHNGSKNALDFILDSWLGYLIHKHGTSVNYHIVSADKGFNAMNTYWKSLGVSVCIEVYQEVIRRTINKNTLSEHDTSKEIYNSLPEKKKQNVKNIYASWQRSKKKKKTSILNNLKQCLDGFCSKREISQMCDYIIKNGI